MVNGQELAKRFHEAYERLAPQFGYETRNDTKEFDASTPNGRLMTSVCQEVGDEIDKAAFLAGFNKALLEYRVTR